MGSKSQNLLPDRRPLLQTTSTPSLRSYRAIKVDQPLKLNTKSYISYYLPILKWFPEYDRKKLGKDLLAGISLTAFQIPFAISLSTMAHVSPYAGLFSLVIPPLIYAVFGSVPTMVVGPQTVVSLVVGQSCEAWSHKSVDSLVTVAVIACTSGFILLSMGLFRMGFIDNAISKAFLRGFIFALAIMMLITELLPELQLEDLYRDEVAQGNAGTTTWDKFNFILKYGPEHADSFSMKLSFIAFSILMVCKYVKKYFTEKRGSKLCRFFPDLLLVVAGFIYLSYYNDWSSTMGTRIIGNLPPNKNHFKVPITSFKEFKELFDISFLVAILGLFDSATAFKAIGEKFDIDISSNRELVSLGLINVVSSVFSALPAFGGYGRSKLNILCSAQTPMAGIVVSVAAIFCMNYMMGAFHYLPLCVLAVIISYIAYNLLEEIPSDLFFYWSVGGYQELLTFVAVVVTTLVWSPQFGVSIGVGLTMIRLLKHTTQSRVQILGRDPVTKKFQNIYAEQSEQIPLEEIEKTMVIKIPEPLIFSNVSDLKKRLSRLEKYGSLKVHPSYPTPLRPVSASAGSQSESYISYVIFDLLGMTYIDMSALQALTEMVVNYHKRGTFVLFARPSIHDLKNKLNKSGITKLQANFVQKQITFGSRTSVELMQFLKAGLYVSLDDALTVVDTLENLTNGGEAANSIQELA
ncbi:uncharacterized protein Ecym_7084 [Eremothecium cymbalariae DBVPG|uniref:STAS domain-containing protein n=1 Tax=Eremothecium cymbalariae (strain CBS 270.75 / DBVPG 7215 / KCTC 17166 / NRRL Y-17582) TaxID=931890 RepID=G8JVS1_ERECY|nr:hypothetical protein Ecym_7084 [Eremothecium cymbalariae DBVPG\